MLAGSAENSARSSGSDKSSDNEGSSHTVTKKRKYRVIKNGVYCLLASQQAAIKQGWQRRNSQKEAPTKKPQDPSEIRRQAAKLGWEKRRHTELKCSLI